MPEESRADTCEALGAVGGEETDHRAAAASQEACAGERTNLRIIWELRALSCLPLELCPPPKQSLMVSRAFSCTG